MHPNTVNEPPLSILHIELPVGGPHAVGVNAFMMFLGLDHQPRNPNPMFTDIVQKIDEHEVNQQRWFDEYTYMLHVRPNYYCHTILDPLTPWTL